MSLIRCVCPHCGNEIETHAQYQGHEVQCPSCNQSVLIPVQVATPVTREPHSSLTKRQMVGLAGSAVLLLGVFAPILNVPIVGSLNYFRNGEGDGVIVLGLAIVSIFFCLVRWCGFLWVTGAGCLGFTAFSFFQIVSQLNEKKETLESELSDNPFGGIALAMAESVSLSWAWIPLFLGEFALIASAAMPKDVR